MNPSLSPPFVYFIKSSKPNKLERERMAQIWLLWCPKNSCTTKSRGATGRSSASSKTSGVKNGCCCRVLVKILRKVKKQSKEMVRSAGASRQSSFQCRYDPLSYSLNFDRSGCGSAVDDDVYYQMYAFSSRFAANPRRIPLAASHTQSAIAST